MMLKNIFLISFIMTALSPVVGYAQSSQTVPDSIIQQAISDTSKTFCKKGRPAYIKFIESCYANHKNKSLDKCILEDYSLIAFDSNLRSAIKQNTGNEIPPDQEGFLSPKAVDKRIKTYYVPRFGNQVENATRYLSPGMHKINDLMGNCSNFGK